MATSHKDAFCVRKYKQEDLEHLMNKVSCLHIDLYLQKLFAGERYDYKKANSMNNIYLYREIRMKYLITIQNVCHI